MATTLSADVSDELRTMLRLRLCEELPYLDRDALDQILDDSISTIETGIKEQSPVMEASKTRTSFFTLPAELRNYIYELVLAPRAGRQSHLYFYDDHLDLEYRRRGEKYPMPPLLTVSRQIRSEALPIFWDIYVVNLDIDTGFNEERGEKTEI